LYLFKKHLEEINDNIKIIKLRGYNPSKTFDLIRTLYNHYTEESLPFSYSVAPHNIFKLRITNSEACSDIIFDYTVFINESLDKLIGALPGI
jgi:hypothetical protein